MTTSAEVIRLTELLCDELVRAMGLSVTNPIGKMLRPVFWRAAEHFSELFASVDRVVTDGGLPAGARALLPHLVTRVDVKGAEIIPETGPLVVASNHPGATDSVVISSGVSRPDLKVVASAIPFLQQLPNVSHHLIFVPRGDPHGRMHVVRESLRHLERGGAILIFGRGRIDPDPAFMPGADQTLSAWSRSLQIFLDHVPRARVLVTMVSGVLHPRFMRHPITWLRSAREDRQRLAMMAQMIEQMLGKKIGLTPRVVFGDLVSEQSAGGKEQILPAVIQAARRLLTSQVPATPRA